MKLIIAEKPSVARDIARVLKLSQKKDGYIFGQRHGQKVVVTWCLGHLVSLCDPGEMSPQWKKWDLNQLPMIPDKWKLKVLPRTKKQFSVVKKLLKDSELAEIVCATDAGREGELIFRLVYEHSKCRVPVKRLWISSLTDEAIAKGFAELKDSSEYDGLYHSAISRAKADWLVGMNFSRFYSIKMGSNFSVGRVQTPTLKILVDRELEIKKFSSQIYMSVKAEFSKEDEQGTYQGELNIDLSQLPQELKKFQVEFEKLYEVDNDPSKQKRRKSSTKIPLKKEIIDYFTHRASNGLIEVSRVSKRDKFEKPPLLHDLTDLQREANKIFGFSANETLKIAQALYEKHKLITYPRTDSRFLSSDMVGQLPKIFSAISRNYQGILQKSNVKNRISSRYINNGKVSDHHAIIPTGNLKSLNRLTGKEGQVFDLISRRFLMGYLDDFKQAVTNISTTIFADESVDRYLSRGNKILNQGWKALRLSSFDKKKQSIDQVIPVWVSEGVNGLSAKLKSEEKQTKPPKRYTDGSLLTAMEFAGKLIDEKELGDVIKESGIGTPATRANIVETLISRKYVTRRGKSFYALDKGIQLINAAFPKLASVSLTAEWEKALDHIANGNNSSREFDNDIESFIATLLNQRQIPSAQIKSDLEESLPTKSVEQYAEQLASGIDLKPQQLEAIRSLTEGHDVFSVLPTGFGKSLIYQLSGLYRGGRTLVVSPLVALMKDQVQSLGQKGIPASFLHGNLSFEESKSVLKDFENGSTKFLFVSPEKASSGSFIEYVTRSPISLLVFDEAHCISTWGKDFRPTFRKLKKLVEMSRPSPVCMLSATVTDSIYQDVVDTLGVKSAKRVNVISMPNNIGIDVVRCDETERIAAISAILEKNTSKPAIIYVPTRDLAEKVSEKVSSLGVTAFFHAGMNKPDKDHVQDAFLKGQVDIVVATIAFGMGINKSDIRTVIHYTSPMSVESYVQEIGRAGRDGKMSKAHLFFDPKDKLKLKRRIEYSFPDISSIEQFIADFEKVDTNKFSFREKAIFNRAVSIGLLKNTRSGFERQKCTDWESGYLESKEQRLLELDQIFQFIESEACRVSLVNNFFSGNTSDLDKSLCGRCDNCLKAIDDTRGKRVKRLEKQVSSAPDYEKMLHDFLQNNEGLSTTAVYQRFAKQAGLERSQFWSVLGKLERKSKIQIRKTTRKVGGRSVSKKIIVCTNTN